MRRRVFAHVVALATVAVVVAGQVQTFLPATALPGALAPQIIAIVDYGPFSPNGDDRRDVGRLAFRLRAAADVDMHVRGNGGVVLRESLGRLEAGRHIWTWDGRRPGGSLVEDGSYEVRVRATRGVVTDRDYGALDVITEQHGRLMTTRPVVHPRASVVHDRVQLMFVTRGWEPDADVGYWGTAQSHARLRIFDERGRIVAERRDAHTYTPRFGWDARDRDGDPLPAGAYVARLRTVDDAGNVLRISRQLHVSDADLVEQVWTASVPAAGAATYGPFYDGCNGCGDFCDPVESIRFAGGLSFRPCVDQWRWGPARHFMSDVPFAAAPVDRYRIGVTGGPSTVGGPGSGRLVLGERKVTPVAGEGTTTSDWVAVDLADQPNLPTGTLPMVWAFLGEEASYDVASFTIEYLHYVPVPDTSSRHGLAR